MNISSPNLVSFKGYDAAPLKRIYLDYNYCGAFCDELKEIGKKENIDIAIEDDGTKWGQDHRVIINNNPKPEMLVDYNVSDIFIDAVKNKYNIDTKLSPYYITGGNSFLGKFDNGENWLILGDDAYIEDDVKETCDYYNVKEENIFPIPQQNFHIDMFMRPIGNNNILVNDEKTVLESLEKFKDMPDFDELKYRVEAYFMRQNAHYAKSEETIETLKDYGFNPIPVAGVYVPSINFMNAIVNKHPDGTLSYITNSTKTPSDRFTLFQENFEQELKEKVPQIKNVYFVEGKKSAADTPDYNYMMDNLGFNNGGLHCMTMEEPDFDRWA